MKEQRDEREGGRGQKQRQGDIKEKQRIREMGKMDVGETENQGERDKWGVHAEVAGVVELDRQRYLSSGSWWERTLMNQGPFSFSAFREKEFHLTLGPLVRAPDSGSQVLVGSTTTSQV